MAVEELKQYLDGNAVKYRAIFHSKAYTAQEVAAAAHISGKKLAKTVIVKLNDQLAMAVLPASDMLDLERVKKAAGAGHAELAHEKDFADKFPGCEVGSMPPFGNLYGMPVYVSQSLRGPHDIAFNAGSHTELIDLDYSDFERLVHPNVM